MWICLTTTTTLPRFHAQLPGGGDANASQRRRRYELSAANATQPRHDGGRRRPARRGMTLLVCNTFK